MNSLYLNVECTIIKQTWLVKKDEPCDPDSSLLARNSLIYSFHMFPPTSILGSVSTPRPSMDRTTYGIIWSSGSLWRQKKQIMDGRWPWNSGSCRENRCRHLLFQKSRNGKSNKQPAKQRQHISQLGTCVSQPQEKLDVLQPDTLLSCLICSAGPWPLPLIMSL